VATDALKYERNLEWGEEKGGKYLQKCDMVSEGLGELHVSGYIRTSDYEKMIEEVNELAIDAEKLVGRGHVMVGRPLKNGTIMVDRRPV
jgi:hypothetical protein